MTFSRHAGIALVGILLGTLVSSATAAPLKYHPKPGEKFVYKVEITADLPSQTETCTGIIAYEVKPDTQSEIKTKGIKLEYNGGLGRAVKYKNTRGPGGFPRVPHGPTFFRDRAYGGLSTRTNKLLVTPQGNVLSLSGSSQAPYLIGDLSILPFEVLPKTEKTSWKNDSSAAVIEGTSPRWSHAPSFLRDRYNQEKRISASEITAFKSKGKKGDLLLFEKTYTLHCGDDQETIDINGTGTWTFNKEAGMSEALNYKYKLVYKESGITINVPVEVKYHRLAGKELTDYEAEQKKKEEEFKKKKGEALAKLKAPLTESEARDILADIKSGDTHRQQAALNKLSRKENPQPDQELLKAIEELTVDSSDHWVQHAARRAASKFPELKRKTELNKAYESTMPLKDSEMGPGLQKNTKLPPGLLVAAKGRHRWNAARVLNSAGNDHYTIQFQQSNRTEVVHWASIRLAPPEVRQSFVEEAELKKLYAAHSIKVPETTPSTTTAAPATSPFKPAKPTAAERSWRTWTDDSGTFKVEAKYLRTEGGTVFLKRKDDGKELKVPLDRLSESDRDLAKRLHENPLSDNPFE